MTHTTHLSISLDNIDYLTVGKSPSWMSPFLLNKLRDFLFISSLSPPCSCVLLPVGGQDDCHMMKLFVEKVVYILHNGRHCGSMDWTRLCVERSRFKPKQYEVILDKTLKSTLTYSTQEF